MAEKKLVNLKVDSGICVVNKHITYGVHISGVITDADKSSFSILAATSPDKNDDVVFNTFMYVKPGTMDEILEFTLDSDLADWIMGESKDPKIPNNISADIRKIILKDVNKWKSCINSSAFKTIVSLDDSDIEVIQQDVILQKKLEEVVEFNTQLQEELVKEKKANANVGIDGFITRYAFKEHILLSGKSGIGKTYTVDKFITDNGYKKEFIALHEGIESTDLLGYPIRHTDGAFVWNDGPLTAAFRIAQTEKVALFMDELLRVPSKELNILVGALTPNSSGNLVLRTGRMIDIVDGIGKSETLEVPMENLWAVATTNMGSNYDVNDMDLALNDRFMTYDLSVDNETIEMLIQNNNPNNLPEIVLTKLFQLYKAINSLVKAQELSYDLNIRHLTKVLKHVTDEKIMKSYLFDLAPYICSRTTEGQLNEVEVKIFKDTVKSLF